MDGESLVDIFARGEFRWKKPNKKELLIASANSVEATTLHLSQVSEVLKELGHDLLPICDDIASVNTALQNIKHKLYGCF